jgi:hypothetical protein
MRLGELELDLAAKEAAGNWQKFHDFCWYRQPEDAEQWTIVYTRNRDSALLNQSNAAAIDKAMEPFTEGEDVVSEHHSHWACGWVDGYAIRVYRDGQVTEAFKTYHGLSERMAQYPVLDDEDYSEREMEAALDNIKDAAWRLKNEYALPEDWESEVYRWLSDNDEVENTDDTGFYPSDEQLLAAFKGLKYKKFKRK